MQNYQQKLQNTPRIILAHTPTPIEHLPRLSAKLGSNIYIKRDDCTGLGGGGNKARKLEYLFADAKAQNADTIITVGGLQSNHARQTAAAAAKLGFDCHLVLKDIAGTPKQDYYHNGNLLLNKLFGANVHHIDQQVKAGVYIHQLSDKLKQDGKTPYYIDLGGSSTIGSLGYIHCAEEIQHQSTDLGVTFDYIIQATGSAGTQAGLVAGLELTGQNTPIHGICVLNNSQVQRNLVNRHTKNVLEYCGESSIDLRDKIITNSDYLGEGYGITNQATIDAVNQAATLEGLILDPVYTGKAMAGLIDLCEKGEFATDSNILFIHTGGSAGVFAYAEVL